MTDRLLKKLSCAHPDLVDVFAKALPVLGSDPYNRSRRYHIKKLEGVRQGEGEYRLKLGRWRFRYDIWNETRQVELDFCGLRREDTY